MKMKKKDKWILELEEEYRQMYPEEEPVTVVAVPCEVYSRVVGYFRPVSQWNEGKRQEFRERKTMKLN